MKPSAGSEELAFSDIVALVRDELNSFSENGDIGYNKAAQAVDKAIQPHITASNQQLLRELEGRKETLHSLGLVYGDYTEVVPVSVIQDKLKEIE